MMGKNIIEIFEQLNRHSWPDSEALSSPRSDTRYSTPDRSPSFPEYLTSRLANGHGRAPGQENVNGQDKNPIFIDYYVAIPAISDKVDKMIQ
jgi:hypothetical protein